MHSERFSNGIAVRSLDCPRFWPPLAAARQPCDPLDVWCRRRGATLSADHQFVAARPQTPSTLFLSSTTMPTALVQRFQLSTSTEPTTARPTLPTFSCSVTVLRVNSGDAVESSLRVVVSGRPPECGGESSRVLSCRAQHRSELPLHFRRHQPPLFLLPAGACWALRPLRAQERRVIWSLSSSCAACDLRVAPLNVLELSACFLWSASF